MLIHSVQRSENVAIVRLEDPSGARMDGTVRGPFCRHARTLPATHQIANGEVTIVDPCYWTPNTPSYYHFSREDHRQGQRTAWGIRRLETHRDDLRMDGRRFVVRAIRDASMGVVDLPELRASRTALIVRAPHASLCQEASELGVLLIVELSDSTELAANLMNFARHAAVSMIVLPACATVDPKPTTDILLVAEMPSAVASIPPWADAIACTEDVAGSIDVAAKPLLVVRRRQGVATLATLRAACDQLQRDLAHRGQFAGYLIAMTR